ncbi:hypothetical protein [Thiocapsa roseopersicina]|uniref:t-SNARE coiled-coil homology domain-containing protein n=1 Tax=Thiocapsa roseopersicina TaxID=1058 RepID=A0A1H2Y9D0_THIRO|nr:hypothetical protein [Thiocapsa roseopersicina]SDX01660.1 hypothetical protein SAMN05421783_11299 [Thiocapsa roseopersicina]
MNKNQVAHPDHSDKPIGTGVDDSMSPQDDQELVELLRAGQGDDQSANACTKPVPSSGPAGSATDVANATEPGAALDQREAALAQREANLSTRDRMLAARVGGLEQREADLAHAWEAQLAREQALAAREAKIQEQTRALAEREIAAEAGFPALNQAALTALEERRCVLQQEFTTLQTLIDQARQDAVADLHARLDAERAERLKTLEAELAALREQAGAGLAAERERYRQTHEKREEAFAQRLDRLKTEQDALTEEQAKLARREGEISWREEDLEGRRAGMEQTIAERAREQVDELTRALDQARRDYHRVRDERDDLHRQLDSQQELLERFDGGPEEALRRLDEAHRKIRSLEQELLARPSATDKERLVALQEQERGWAADRENLLRKLNTLRAERGRWVIGVQELESQRDELEVLRRRRDVLVTEMEKYAAEVERMRGLYQPAAERDARIRPITQPWVLDFKNAPAVAISELDWLNGIVERCEESGLRFPPRLVHAFHTALKTAELSPLAVLAGVSGTGKSELPRLYARFGGLAFLGVPVQPNWDSPQSLFGFFNSVDNRFNATTLLRAMVQAQHASDDPAHSKGLGGRLLLVLLDEMNLAHVEQYFSDLLSKLEARRGEREDVALDIDLGAGMDPYPLKLGRNVLWVGTMNEDETTKALSDKVIDRSNLLFFPRPRTLHRRAEVTLASAVPLLDRAIWEGWQEPRSPFTEEEMAPYREVLETINTALEQVGRALGHRVWQAVEAYLANHPEVRDARARNDSEARERAMRRAFEDQMVLKVMSKLRGIETSGDAKRNCLDPIRQQIENPDLGLSLAEDFDIACRVGAGAFVWSSARYLENAQ